MADNDDLYFSFDEDEEGKEADVVEAEETRNRSFLIGAIILGAVFVLGIAAVVLFFLFGRGPQEPAVSANELTNQANMTLFAMTQTAAFEATPVPPEGQAAEETEEPTEEALPPTPTLPAPTEEETATVEEGATEVAEVTPAVTEGAVSPEPTSGIIEVTPLGGEEEATITAPTPEVGPAGGEIGATPAGALPETGFAGSAGLAGAGLLALVLVAIVVVVRRIRLR